MSSSDKTNVPPDKDTNIQNPLISPPDTKDAPSSPKSPTDASEKRGFYRRQGSSDKKSLDGGSKSKLRNQSSVDSLTSAARRRASYSRRSSFDLMHVDSVASQPDITKLQEIDLSNVPWWTSYRFRYAIIWFLGFVCLYAQRVNLSIAIVTMVDHQYFHELAMNQTAALNAARNYSVSNMTRLDMNLTGTTEPEDDCPINLGAKATGDFRWTKPVQGLLLGGFFWGYMLLQIPGGRLSERFGSKKVIAIGMFPVAVINILSPVLARWSPYAFLVGRVLMGMGEGVMYPAAQAFWARWAPPNERSRLIGLSYAGGQFGNAIIFPIGGFLCAYGFDGGWASVFYMIGVAGFIWCVVWCIFIHDSPSECPGISEIEMKYIEMSIGTKKVTKHQAW